MMDQTRLAQAFRERHRSGGLILPNCWDAASARIFQAAGFDAVATTSAGVAWSRGVRDGEGLGREDMMREVAAIARATTLPFNADVEAGYGPSQADAAETARATWAAGAVGLNFEDVDYAAPRVLMTIPDQQARIAAIRAATPEVVINARTDVFLLGLGDSEAERIDMAACRISTGPYPRLAVLERLKTLADGLAKDWKVMSPAGDGLASIGAVFG